MFSMKMVRWELKFVGLLCDDLLFGEFQKANLEGNGDKIMAYGGDLTCILIISHLNTCKDEIVMDDRDS